MRRKLLITLACVLVIAMTAGIVLFTGCTKKDELVEPVPETFINETLGFELTGDVEMPTPSVDSGRGAQIEKLVVQHAKSYENDEYLKDDVVLFRQWQYSELYNSLAQKAKDNPRYLNTYRFQAEVYLIKSKYEAALSALDKVLYYNHDDVYALGLSAYIQHIQGNLVQRDARLAALKNVSQKCHDDVMGLINDVSGWLQDDLVDGLKYTKDMNYDAIGVLGVAPDSKGNPQGTGILRAKDAIKAAYYSRLTKTAANPKIIVSGGAIDTQYSEASSIGNWIVRNSTAAAQSLGIIGENEVYPIYGDDVIFDEEARDTVGNAIGICKAMVENNLHNLVIIASENQIQRAYCIFRAYIKANNLDITLSTHAVGGNEATSGETKYAYVCAAGAFGLFTKDDYAAHTQAIVSVTATPKVQGEVKADKAAYAHGETATLTVTPATGFELKSLSAKTSSGKSVEIKDNKFTVGVEDIIIEPKFRKIEKTSSFSFFQEKYFGTTSNGDTTDIAKTMELCEANMKASDSNLVSVHGDTVPSVESGYVAGQNNSLAYGKMGGLGMAASGRIGWISFEFKPEYKIKKVAVLAVKFTEDEGHLQVNGIDPTKGELQGKNGMFDYSYVVEYEFAQPTNELHFATYADQKTSTDFGKVIVYGFTIFLDDSVEIAKEYSVNVAASDNGVVTPSLEEAAEGMKITLTPNGNKYYYLDTLSVKQGETEIEVKDNSFTMPAGDVTVNATFAKRYVATANTVLSGADIFSTTTAGTVVFDKAFYEKDETVTLQVKTGHGFALEGLTAKTPAGVPVRIGSDNTFKMPEDDVIVTATFKMTQITISFFNDGTFGTSENGTTNIEMALEKALYDILAVNSNIVSVTSDNAPDYCGTTDAKDADGNVILDENGDKVKVPNNALGYGKHGGFGMAAGGRVGWFTLTFKEGYNIKKVVVNGVNQSATEGHLVVNGVEAKEGTEFTGKDNTFSYDTAAEYEFDVATNVLTFATATDEVNGKVNYGRVIVYSITIYLAD